MNGKVLAIFLALTAIIGGAGMYYLQVYGFYEEVQATNVDDVQLTSLESALPEPILYENFKAIDAQSSPLRYRACFETPMSQALLTETFTLYDDPIPTVAPGWFACFDATAIGTDLEEGTAIAFLGTANVIYGFDRVVAITEDGRGYVWHQINICGEKVFDGDPPPEGCPPAPEQGE
ncbi:MAG: histidine kinase [Silicimonas sp.]|nr:histidine kinase [Silicimonas sp.]